MRPLQTPQQSPGSAGYVPARLERMAATPFVDPPVAGGSNQVSAAEPQGSENKASPTAVQEPVYPGSLTVQLITGETQTLSTKRIYCRKILLFGVMQWNNGIATPNAQNAFAGFQSHTLPFLVLPWNGFAYEIDAPLGHLYDLSRIHCTGTTGDSIFLFYE